MDGALQPNTQVVAHPSSATHDTLIRPATWSDAPAAVELIYLPMGRLADYLFGADDPVRARDVLQQLFVQPSNRFSRDFCDVAEINGEVVGVLLAYPSRVLSELAVPMGKQLRGIVGWGGMLRLLKRSLPLMTGRETGPGEYYIYTLAVRPEFQNNGLGARLLGRAEHQARTIGLDKCSLGVTLNNHRARRFYERHGYEVVETAHTPKLERAIGYPGVARMVKRLPPPSEDGRASPSG